MKFNTEILQYNNEVAYELEVQEGELVFKDVAALKNLCNLYGFWGGTGIYKIKDNVYAAFKYFYDDTSELVIADLSTEEVKKHEFKNVDCEYIQYVDDKLYLVTLGEDLTLYTYDSRYEVLTRETLLVNPGVRYAGNIYFEITEEGLWTSFDAVASSNSIDYQTTFVLTYDREHNLKNYYRYGDKTFRYCGDVVRMADGCYVLGTASMYNVLTGRKSEIAQTPKKELVYDDATGKFLYYEAGEWVSDKYTMMDYGGGSFLIMHGAVADYVNGVTLYEDAFYFFANGQVQKQHTGLALYDNEWFYVVDGVLQTEYNGLLEHDGSLFFVAAGRIVYGATGLVLFGDTWYYLAAGQVQTHYTGLVEYNGAWFYLVNGVLASDYTGTVEFDGAWFDVVCGQVVA